MLIVMASILGLLSLGGFLIASVASASGAEQEFTDWISVALFGLFGVAFWYASPTLSSIL